MSVTWRAHRELMNPGFAEDIDNLLGPSPFAWVVIQGKRTNAEQAALWANFQQGGPVAAPPGKSAHEFGLAVDIALDNDPAKPGLQPDWDIRHQGWAWLFVTLRDHPSLESGVNFPKPDADHVQRRWWKSFVKDIA